MPDPLWINASAGAPAYSAAELRQAMGLAMMYDGRNMGVRKGVRPGGNQLSVSLVGTTITVQPGLCALDPALTTPQGSYWVAIPVAETHTLTAADPTNPRKDIVIARVYDHDEDSSGLRLARSEYLVGTPAGSPAEPALPASATKLALIDVPASGGGSPVVTDRRQWTVATGGILPVADATQRDAVAAYEGLAVYRRDTDAVEYYDGAAWKAHPALQTWTPTLTNFAVGAGGTLTARHTRLGSKVDFHLRANLGTGFSVGSSPRFTLPVTPVGYEATEPFGLAFLLDAGTANWTGYVWLVSGSTVEILRDEGDGTPATISSTQPFTWAAGDRISVVGSYFV